MNRNKVNYYVDLLMAIVFAVMAVTGLVLFFKFPSGERTGRLSFLDLTKHQWGDIHSWTGIAIVVLVLIHLILHWKWIVVMTKDIFKKK